MLVWIIDRLRIIAKEWDLIPRLQNKGDSEEEVFREGEVEEEEEEIEEEVEEEMHIRMNLD